MLFFLYEIIMNGTTSYDFVNFELSTIESDPVLNTRRKDNK